MKKMNKKGFTLAELLIVVAIIAVLVAVAIPVFTAQLEKSKEATDVANLRSGYAEAVAKWLTDGGTQESAVYKVQQGTANWTNTSLKPGLQSELQNAASTLEGLASGSFKVQVTGTDSVTVTVVPVT